MSDLDLLYSDIEDDLRASVRDLLADRCDPDAITRLYDGDRSVVDVLWKSLTEIGMAGLLVPENRGGQGASSREVAVVLEELGRAVAPVPFLTSAVIATTLLLESESNLLALVASGDRTAALLLPWSMSPDGEIPAFDLVGESIHGTATSVAGAIEADVLLAPVRTASGLAIYAVEAAGASLDPVVSLDMTRELADVSLNHARGELVMADAESAVRRALDAGAALLASEQLGVARWCLETTVAYVKERKQFGRPVGGFQALKHRLADLYTRVETACAAARHATAALSDHDPDTSAAASIAQAFNAEVSVHAAEEAVQLHAGIGMTWEHPAHLYLKRAKASQIALGTPGRHRARLAPLIGLPS
ncbi:acyl-CoA/acyl-ACP dehydrogenase [Nocardioides panacisoli]|uniref:acyl-CoA dehydrogenase family protein n=1 Tax=Nocardioides panacisoli TaxID=627624 RepID=UPI001C6346B2|nr:acyl-CoA dehydrogenase family protein [Nocardioides panacisoli]QYJ03536.1 acyl-CoA/acyl-ACP dehydrogenase [Nocardioides panacisoli]